MFFTRCPKCETTFRITKEALQKAAGQVRCGRCAHIFDARGALRERVEPATEIEMPEQSPKPQSAAPVSPAPEHSAAEPTAAESSLAESPAAQTPVPQSQVLQSSAAASPAAPRRDRRQNKPPVPADRVPSAATAAPSDADGTAHEHIVLESTESVSKAATGPDRHMSADEIQAVLTKAPPPPAAMPAWMADASEDTDSETKRARWALAVIAVLLLLLGQSINHYRAQLAGFPVIGAVIRGSYGFFGVDLSPRWDLQQYVVVDSVAIAETAGADQGNLVIRSRVRNTGPRSQPYPHIHLKLLDRWEDTVASRIFSPGEYLAAATDSAALMAANNVAEARLVIVDPGPDASGFELDVCVEIDQQLSCAADMIFD